MAFALPQSRCCISVEEKGPNGRSTACEIIIEDSAFMFPTLRRLNTLQLTCVVLLLYYHTSSDCPLCCVKCFNNREPPAVHWTVCTLRHKLVIFNPCIVIQ